MKRENQKAHPREKQILVSSAQTEKSCRLVRSPNRDSEVFRRCVDSGSVNCRECQSHQQLGKPLWKQTRYSVATLSLVKNVDRRVFARIRFLCLHLRSVCGDGACDSYTIAIDGRRSRTNTQPREHRCICACCIGGHSSVSLSTLQ